VSRVGLDRYSKNLGCRFEITPIQIAFTELVENPDIAWIGVAELLELHDHGIDLATFESGAQQAKLIADPSGLRQHLLSPGIGEIGTHTGAHGQGSSG
jgi:hypothetical protein